MALVKIGNHKGIHSQGCEIAPYIQECILEEEIKWNKNYALSYKQYLMLVERHVCCCLLPSTAAAMTPVSVVLCGV